MVVQVGLEQELRLQKLVVLVVEEIIRIQVRQGVALLLVWPILAEGVALFIQEQVALVAQES